MKNVYAILIFLAIFLSGMFGGVALVNWIGSFITVEPLWLVMIKFVLVILYTVTGGIASFLAAYFAAIILRSYMK
jgi:hypothetical protein